MISNSPTSRKTKQHTVYHLYLILVVHGSMNESLIIYSMFIVMCKLRGHGSLSTNGKVTADPFKFKLCQETNHLSVSSE